MAGVLASKEDRASFRKVMMAHKGQIAGSRQNSARSREVAKAIRNEIRTDENVRFLRGLDIFAAHDELPERFRLLLARLDEIESRRSRH